MGVLRTDYPLLALGLAAVIYARFFRPRLDFQIACHAAATFAAQYSFMVTLSLQRLVPIFAASDLKRATKSTVGAFKPFLIYAIAATLLLSAGWRIPPGVSAFYGKYRFVVQLFNLLMLGLAASAMADVLHFKNAPLKLFDMFTGLSLAHGTASMYQFVAARTGLPLIGISRPHIEDGLDVAAFMGGDQLMLRPGGLAGEPKTVAIIFAIYLLVWAFGAPPRVITRTRRIIETTAVSLAGVGFLVAMSTSAFIGFGIAIAVLALRFPAMLSATSFRVLAALMLAVGAWYAFGLGDIGFLRDLLMMRTVDRLSDRGTALDGPVEIAVQAIQDTPQIAMFGTGMGGSSFLVMARGGSTFSSNLSYAPNVLGVLLVTELGIVGALLLVGPMVFKLLRPMPPVESPVYGPARLYFVFGVAAFCMQMPGSGIAMGFPLAIGAACAYADIATRWRAAA